MFCLKLKYPVYTTTAQVIIDQFLIGNYGINRWRHFSCKNYKNVMVQTWQMWRFTAFPYNYFNLFQIIFLFSFFRFYCIVYFYFEYVNTFSWWKFQCTPFTCNRVFTQCIINTFTEVKNLHTSFTTD